MERVAAERRRHPRARETVCTWLSFKNTKVAYGTLTSDISPDGAQFVAGETMQVGEKVLLNLQLPAEAIECKGKICWNSRRADGSCAFGVRFLDLLPAERSQLGLFLAMGSQSAMAGIH